MDSAQRVTVPYRRQQPILLRLLLKMANNIRVGKLRIVAPDGMTYDFEGTEEGPEATLMLHDLATVRRLLISGDMGLAEAYMDDLWETPDLIALLELGQRNAQALRKLEKPSALSRLLSNLIQACRRNTRRGARKNIAYHYDLGNDFYKLWLDVSMTYSCAIFADRQQSLFEAQQNKYQHILELLQLEPRHHVLEIGSGWGGFAVYAASRTGCRVTSITLSEQQLQEAKSRAAAAGLADRIRFQLCDYRDVREQYDRIASIEMFEAVGEHYWDAYFKAVHDCLVPGGRAAIQAITINDAAFRKYRKTTDFIQRYIFPGGILPCPSRWEQCVRSAGLRTESRRSFGLHYADTLRVWYQRFQAAHPAILALGFDQRFLRMWHYYLAYCHAGFITGHVDVMQTAIVKDT
jgi:cyclopropane-fatty-acyl-phospholipid synthase